MKSNDIFGLVTEAHDEMGAKPAHQSRGWRANTKDNRRDIEGSPETAITSRQIAHQETVPSQRRNGFDPIFPFLQSAPSRWLERKFPTKRQKALLLLGMSLGWCLVFAILADTSIAPVRIEDTYLPVKQLQCTDSFWLPNYGCGLHGEDCPVPTEEEPAVAFHCPANCAATIKVPREKPHLVGPLSIVEQPLVIGGPIYRADSWICASAVHADLLDDSRGGCGVLTRLGQTNSYTASRFNGVSSIGVRTYFPQSYRFKIESGFDCRVSDSTWMLPYISVAFSALVFLFSLSPLVCFSTAVGVGFVQVGFMSTSFNEAEKHAGVTRSGPLTAVATYVPAVLLLALVYTRSVGRTFDKLSAQLEKTVLWLGVCWLAMLKGDTLLESRLVIPCMATFIALYQLHELHQKRLPTPLRLYGLFFGLVVFSLLVDAIPTVVLILALLLLPGSAVQSRSNLVYQGLLVGLLVSGLVKNGLGSWPSSSLGNVSFMSSDTTAATSFDLPSPPQVHEPQISIADSFANITFTWVTPVPKGVDGISMLINDVERGRVLFGAAGADDSLGWMRGPQAVADYIRFAWVRDNEVPKYGDVGTWKVNGEWTGLGSDGK
ncbi:hypothetical protein E8E14_002948 [Neopestalotiopsis sp. 37M]|nr:hypothetical protein E8E14_002948 [Neopestalotiopsis sp. 37M]